MNLREGLGLLLLLGGVALMPFVWWLSRGWLFVVLALVGVGGPLFFSARRARRIAHGADGGSPAAAWAR
ncbi:hypothetical protein [Pseudomonas sp. F(2018)]|uniref:hypothetical protein n=1 Tax=Pseudomonas sp. F(2018) TaxID=2502240 RepID=UPI0010F67BF2|nr:hypothetical protein [Pseudomonas sp. F(2018)]